MWIIFLWYIFSLTKKKQRKIGKPDIDFGVVFKCKGEGRLHYCDSESCCLRNLAHCEDLDLISWFVLWKQLGWFSSDSFWVSIAEKKMLSDKSDSVFCSFVYLVWKRDMLLVRVESVSVTVRSNVIVTQQFLFLIIFGSRLVYFINSWYLFWKDNQFTV